jgi:predicted CoA-substrate-specific enzyme activase
MLFGGIDIGTKSIKVVLLNQGRPCFSTVLINEDDEDIAYEAIFKKVAREADVSFGEITGITATGVGKGSTPSIWKKKSDPICHARGAFYLIPSGRTVLDIGAEGSRAIKLEENGKIADFAINSKCAAGTGIFLETMAKIMDLSLEEIGMAAARADGKAKISSFCAVFAESEVISNIHRGVPKAHIVSGIHESVVDRLIELLNQVKTKENLVISGGGAKNIGLIKALENRLGFTVSIPDHPEIVGALGAALIAQDYYQKI